MTTPSNSTVRSPRSDEGVYPALARRTHWWSAALILVMWPLGFCSAAVTVDSVADALLRIHLILGLAVLALTAVRVLHRVRTPRPHLPDTVTGWQRSLAEWVHRGLGLLQPLVVLAGVAAWRSSGVTLNPLAVAAGDIDASAVAGAHRWMAHLMMLLFVIHFAGVVFHDSLNPGAIRRMRRARRA